MAEGDVWTGRNLWETNATEGAASGRFKITSVSFGRDGLMAIGWCLDPQGPQKGGLVFWHERRRLALLNTPTNQPLFIFSPEFTPDGRFLAAAVGEDSAMNNSRFHVWRVERHSTERVVDSLKLHHMMTLGEDYSVMAVDNGRIAYASSRATNAASEIHLVELEGPQTDRVLAHGAPLGFQWLGFTPDRRQLLAVNTNYEIVALDLVTGDEVTPPIRDRNGLKAKDRKAVNFSLSPDGSKLALDAGAGVEIWDWKARRYLYSLPEPEGRILFVRWSPDAQHLAVCSWSETSIWHLPLVERVLADLGLSP